MVNPSFDWHTGYELHVEILASDLNAKKSYYIVAWELLLVPQLVAFSRFEPVTALLRERLQPNRKHNLSQATYPQIFAPESHAAALAFSSRFLVLSMTTCSL
jgi:hypothetical protein